MVIEEKKKVLIDYLHMKVLEQDWRAVADTANDLRSLREIDFAAPISIKKEIPLQAIPPVESKIPHHLNEVRNLLSLSHEELVEKMFPLHVGQQPVTSEG